MEFLGIGYQELLLVLILLLVVVGPERLPGMAYQIGRAVRTLQQYARQVRDEFSDEIGYLEEQVRVVKGEVGTLNTELRDQTSKFNAELRDQTTKFNTELRQATEPIDSGLRELTAPPTAEPTSAVPSEAALVLTNGATPPAESEPRVEPPVAGNTEASGQPPLVF